MGGWKVVAARRAAARIVDTLTDVDRFVVLGFDHEIEHPARLGAGLAAATDQNRFAAVEFLAGLEARGGTELHRPVEQAAAILAGTPPHGSRNAVLVLVTDGQIGQEDAVLRSLRPYLQSVRIFTVGIDRAVNAGFLNRLADAGGGRCELVESEDALDDALDRIHRAVATPIIEDIVVTLQGAELVHGATTPARRADCYAGAPCMIGGRYRGGRPSAIRLTGRHPDGSPWTRTVGPTPVDNPALRTVWARAQIRTLEDRYAVAPGEALAKEITATSLAHGVLSRFTAFVAVDPSDPTGSTSPRPVVQPVESPDGWAYSLCAAPGRPASMPTAAMAAGAPVEALEGGRALRRRSDSAAPAPNPFVELVRLLDEVEQWLRAAVPPTAADRHQLGQQLFDIAVDESRTELKRALAELAAAVQAWDDEVGEKVKAARALLPPPVKSKRRFWR
jgi:Ca-activated chloride channel family protein